MPRYRYVGDTPKTYEHVALVPGEEFDYPTALESAEFDLVEDAKTDPAPAPAKAVPDVPTSKEAS